ncbi:MAG: sigma-54-dependent Fis family transcriptional regulator [Planctomycetes bacterium]|nr:sigma-54-dependent Fis family transcriptional regulator [Planctomycetota bacterium]
MPDTPQWTVLVVDDHESTRETIAETMRGYDAVAEKASSVQQALAIFSETPIDIVITDLRLPDGDGLGLMEEILRRAPQVPVILITGHGSEDIAVDAIRRGAHDYIPKPIGLNRLRAVMEGAVRTRKLHLENLALHKQIDARRAFSRIVGNSPAITAIKDIIRQVAPTGATVLVTGENGTGKELVADAIHASSDRAGRPLIKIGVPALPRDLLESELFGHEKGAFTGALQSRKGRFELAHGGTLFLDEIGDMPVELQTKLLRALEMRSFERVGGTETIAVDIRLVCATNRDLEAMVKAGTFREDLYYRINVLRIDLPPLRERRDDIPLLVDHFMDEFTPAGRDRRHVNDEAMLAMTAYDWPGNVRELRNLVERLNITVAGDSIELKHLPAQMSGAGPASAAGPVGAAFDGQLAGRSLDEIERAAVLSTIKAQGGNKTQSAKVLGIGLKTLYRKLDAYREQGFEIPE